MRAVGNIYFFIFFLISLTTYVVVRILVANSRAEKETEMLRRIIPQKLGFKTPGPNYQLLQRTILALIPCKGLLMAGKLAPLGNNTQLWLCFLKNRMLFISKKTGDAIEVNTNELVKLRLVDKSKTVTMELQGGKSRLELKRLDDLVKVINVLISHGIVLDYEEQ